MNITNCQTLLKAMLQDRPWSGTNLRDFLLQNQEMGMSDNPYRRETREPPKKVQSIILFAKAKGISGFFSLKFYIIIKKQSAEDSLICTTK